MNEKRKWRIIVRDTTFNAGKQIFGVEGSQAVPVRPSAKGRLERRRRSEVEKVKI
jgi:hypothetical protein